MDSQEAIFSTFACLMRMMVSSGFDAWCRVSILGLLIVFFRRRWGLNLKRNKIRNIFKGFNMEGRFANRIWLFPCARPSIGILKLLGFHMCVYIFIYMYVYMKIGRNVEFENLGNQIKGSLPKLAFLVIQFLRAVLEIRIFMELLMGQSMVDIKGFVGIQRFCLGDIGSCVSVIFHFLLYLCL